MRVPGVTRSRPRPGGRPDGGDLQVAPLLECVEPGHIAVFERACHSLEQLQPRVLLASEPLQVHLKRPITCRHSLCQKGFERSSGVLAVFRRMGKQVEMIFG